MHENQITQIYYSERIPALSTSLKDNRKAVLILMSTFTI